MKEVKKMNSKFLMNLQFFAEGEPGAANGGLDTGNTNNSTQAEPGSENINTTEPDAEPEKTFTQEELRRIAAREKRQGRQSVLNSIGVKSEDEAKRIVDAYNKFMAAENPEQKKEIQGNSDYEQLQRRVLLAESKLAALSLGVNQDCVDDAIAIANLKAESTGDDVSDVLEDMKKDKKYAGFFAKKEAVAGATGTGVGVSHGTTAKPKPGDFGRSLWKDKDQPKENKKSYFKRS